jgi:hypothetical protein
MTGGQDKGFCLYYYKLSYRRKLRRTLWLMAAAIIGTVALAMISEGNVARTYGLILAAAVIGSWQARYCYYKWKSESSAAS